jgi:hypothetical protein
MNTFNDLMIDIETLGTDSNCVILSMGAVPFNIETGEISNNRFYQKISLKSSLANGFEINPDTLKWWVNQDNNVFKEAISGKESIEDVLLYFNTFVKENFPKKNFFTWGNSARFDLGILHHAYRKLNIDVPWQHYYENDVRTLGSRRRDLKDAEIFTGTKHNPVDDCIHQIKYVTKIFNQGLKK